MCTNHSRHDLLVAPSTTRQKNADVHLKCNILICVFVYSDLIALSFVSFFFFHVTPTHLVFVSTCCRQSVPRADQSAPSLQLLVSCQGVSRCLVSSLVFCSLLSFSPLARCCCLVTFIYSCHVSFFRE